MKILQETNEVYDLTNLPNVLEENMYYCVLDYSDQKYVDFNFVIVTAIDQYLRPAADLSIGKYRVQVPLDWSIVIADKNSGALELLELQRINDREFQAFCINPIDGYMPQFPDVEMENMFSDVLWTMPRMHNGHILAVPLSDEPSPLCALFVRDTNKLPESLDITKIFS